MKTIKFFVVLAIITLIFPLAVSAQNSGEKNDTAIEETKKEKQIEKERMIAMGMNMLAMMQKQVVATNDGGVVVLWGNKLLKYDKDLNLLKAVELRTDAVTIQK